MQIPAIINHKAEYRYNKKKYIQSDVVYNNLSSDKVFSDFSIDNLKGYCLINFKGYTDTKPSIESGIGCLINETVFFRYPETDEKVQQYILDTFGKDSEINIVSGACSDGSEAKSYKMMLDSLGDRLHVSGFDISEDIIEKAKSDKTQIILGINLSDLPIKNEFFLSELCTEQLTPYQQKCKEKFKSYYIIDSEICYSPTYPSAQQQMEILQKILENEESRNLLKKAYYDGSLKRNHYVYTTEDGKHLLLENASDINFGKALDDTISQLNFEIRTYNACQNIREKDVNRLKCEFKKGDVLKLENLYKQASINALLYRNALYYTLCDSPHRDLRSDAKKIMDNISRQMNKIVKMDG